MRHRAEGTEVKSLRTTGAQLKDGYVLARNGELFLQFGAHSAVPAGRA